MNMTKETATMIQRTIALFFIALSPWCWANERLYVQIDSEITVAETSASSQSVSHLAVGSKIDHVLNHFSGTPTVKLTIAPVSYKDALLEVDTVLSVKRLIDAKANRFEQRDYSRKFSVKFGETSLVDPIDGVRFSLTAKQLTEAEFKSIMEQALKNAHGAK